MNSVTASCASSSIVASPTGSPVLMLSDIERAALIDVFWSYPESRTFAELLIDSEEDRVLRAVLIGMLREAERKGQ